MMTTSIKKQLQKIEREVGMGYQIEYKQGYIYSKDGNKGQGSSLLLCHHYKVTKNNFHKCLVKICPRSVVIYLPVRSLVQ